MFVNYMDYSSDAHVTMFTKDQVALMNSVLDGIISEDKKLSSSKWSKVYNPRIKGAAPMTVHLPEVNFVFAQPTNANATRVVAAAPPTVSVRDVQRWP
jgi:hypothetical protein